MNLSGTLEWRESLAIPGKIGLAVSVACVTGLAAQLKIVLPWTPVPVTCQTLVVLLSAVLLGRCWAGASQITYLLLGAAGVPWFGGWSSGLGVILGPTGGYLFGFILASLFLGYGSYRYPTARKFWPMLGLMLLANFALIHIPGLCQLGLWCRLSSGASPSLVTLLSMGTVPFLVGDIIKVVAAASCARALLPQKSRFPADMAK